MPQYDKNIIEKFDKEELSVGWPWRFLLISLVSFGIALFIYLGLFFGYRSYLNQQISKKDAEIAQLAATVPKEDQERLVKFYSQLQNLKSLLDQHIINSKILPFLEKNTNRRVFYPKLEADIRRRTLNLEGVAESFEVLAQQLEAFRRAKEVERFIITDSQLVEGQVRFRLSVVLKPEVFK